MAHAELLGVEHGSLVTLQFALPETATVELVRRLGERGQGQLAWLEASEA